MIAWLSHAWTAVMSFIEHLNEGELRLLAGAVPVGTVLISVFAITRPLRYQKSAALLDQAVRALERAYNALTVDGAQTAPVPADRLNWLTTARNLETYKALKREIGVNVHRRIVDDHEEHWRHLFYLALQGNAYHQPTYYREPITAPRAQRTGGIEPHSAVIVHAFAKWPDGRPDPVEHADFDRIFEETDPRPGNVGLRLFLDDTENRVTRRFCNLPDPYPKRTWWRRCVRTLRLRKRL
ncbi:hypothetical protein [Paraburkholderia caballeronis]|uniref:Uncharacterized protein n=1 Tax=Paraburkholderia caballeronis TaxID=416943 RepID=A0A1H7L403_9BURK|nr:hypothetical protein [Paraburkholderia caballeronis]PXW28275.1 hypothetical protein C7403_102167 [Paraburkholderia caballeronis]PXX03641.1 hypothetical protein C7407_102167 [Paraburkholderia caballeronis]RAK04385.1 hypothetical protein C7409_102167 [Paraburkholderia caballeronis]SED82401.1 hypothetical protein SAMN05445871_4011 [Paraburkholderia caballeronis]SEK93530.1 hypothetical protein SAMN05192542_104167 [Paraburkholderia caballeronis]